MADANPKGDRGPKPQSPGDRAYDSGDVITVDVSDSIEDSVLDEDGKIPQGYFVDFGEHGTVERPENYDDDGAYEAVLQHAAEPGEKNASVQVRGIIRVAESVDENWPVIDEVDDDDLIVLR